MKSLPCLFVVSILSLCWGSYAEVCAQNATPSGPASSGASVPPLSPAPGATVAVPGPIRSFLRMAAISQKVSPDEIAPLLARNIFLLCYEGPQNQARETEFLILLNRYVQQARELVVLAGPTGVIHVSNCEDAKPLLQVLGYRS